MKLNVINTKNPDVMVLIWLLGGAIGALSGSLILTTFGDTSTYLRYLSDKVITLQTLGIMIFIIALILLMSNIVSFRKATDRINSSVNVQIFIFASVLLAIMLMITSLIIGNDYLANLNVVD
ncbi:MAG: membrane protein of unknown function [Promethearchaeota archaeon]|jgi:uncharacterized membrane protein YidH (DUF202 family)|nr:MAG: membrane protein of unknown function [Candidatus Lokiarchaeota archaeon]